MAEPLEAVEQDEHPGIQCHVAHPGIPHVVAVPPPRDPGPREGQTLPPPNRTNPSVDRGAVDWTRFDEWATRTKDYIEKAAQADSIGAATLLDCARVSADVAHAASPHGGRR